MRRAPLVALALFSAAVTVGGCKDLGTISGNGTAKEESRDLDAFSEVEITGAFDVTVANDGQQAVKLSGDANLLPLIKTEVTKKRLVISRAKDFNTVRPLKIEITLPSLRYLGASGASTLDATAIASDHLEVQASGASKVTLKGATPRLTATLTGASKLEARELKVQKLTLNASGASKAAALASDELNVTLSGASNAEIAGGPKKVTQDVTGASHLDLP